MINTRISKQGISDFIDKYAEYTVAVSSDKILMQCILPGHIDNNRSAVMYLNTGIYSCPKCGSHKVNAHQDIYKLENNATIRESYYFDIDRYPLHYYKIGDVIGAANVVDNIVVGLTTRIPGERRRYITTGSSGFRLDSPLITESLTDAITLLELGYNAGSICSVANWRNISNKCIYVPQNDKPGLDVVAKLRHTVIFKWYWKLDGYKDIAMIPSDILELILKPLESYKL